MNTSAIASEAGEKEDKLARLRAKFKESAMKQGLDVVIADDASVPTASTKNNDGWEEVAEDDYAAKIVPEVVAITLRPTNASGDD